MYLIQEMKESDWAGSVVGEGTPVERLRVSSPAELMAIQEDQRVYRPSRIREIQYLMHC